MALEVWSQPSGRATQDLDLWYQLRDAEGRTQGLRQQLTASAADELDPAVVWVENSTQFLIVYTRTTPPTPSGTGIRRDVWGAFVDTAPAGPAPRPFAIDTSPDDQDSARATWVSSKRAALVVYRTRNTVGGAWVRPADGNDTPGVERRLALSGERTGLVSWPSVAWSPRTDRILVAWGVMRTREDIEIGTMAPSDDHLIPPARTGWRHKLRECNFEMAPGCIEGGDRPALAYNPRTGQFGLAIADDLNDGSRVEAFVIHDGCAENSCPVRKIGADDDVTLPEDERERALATFDRVATVTMAPLGDGFLVGVAHGGEGPWGSTDVGVLTFSSEERGRTGIRSLQGPRGNAVVIGAQAAARGIRAGGLLLLRHTCSDQENVPLCGQSLQIGDDGHPGNRSPL